MSKINIGIKRNFSNSYKIPVVFFSSIFKVYLKSFMPRFIGKTTSKLKILFYNIAINKEEIITTITWIHPPKLTTNKENTDNAKPQIFQNNLKSQHPKSVIQNPNILCYRKNPSRFWDGYTKCHLVSDCLGAVNKMFRIIPNWDF